jgi:rare lipoprotein A
MNATWLSIALMLTLGACATQPQQASAPAPQPCTQTGIASWYPGAERGKTSPNELVAAHPTLPFDTTVQVTALETGRTVTVRINDRGPFSKGRIIDLSEKAAQQLGIKHDGVGQVKLAVDGAVDQGCPWQDASLTPS